MAEDISKMVDQRESFVEYKRDPLATPTTVLPLSDLQTILRRREPNEKTIPVFKVKEGQPFAIQIEKDETN